MECVTIVNHRDKFLIFFIPLLKHFILVSKTGQRLGERERENKFRRPFVPMIPFPPGALRLQAQESETACHTIFNYRQKNRVLKYLESGSTLCLE